MSEDFKAPRAPQDRFANEWRDNFAVSANAGSGKTTAISRRLAAMALATEDGPDLSRTAVVTYTKKAAQEMSQRARKALMESLQNRNAADGLSALVRMESVFFGTIHSFCIMLSQRYGHEKGINLKPSVVQEETDQDKAYWQEFVQQDGMHFEKSPEALTRAFLRHVKLDDIFEFARRLTHSQAEDFIAAAPKKLPAGPDVRVLDEPPQKGEQPKAFEKRMDRLRAWAGRYARPSEYLPFDEPPDDKYRRVSRFYQPIKNWLAAEGAALAGELSLRYREWRLQRGIQTFADQIETALLVLRDDRILKQIRDDGWRIILDEAQDTDPQQFEILVEITRPADARRGTWPDGGGEPPRAGHFCMVGDGQQSIYGSRADIRNFVRHVEAFTGKAGESLQFVVTYRTPRNVIAWLNRGFPGAFGGGRRHNLGLPAAEGAEPPLLQVAYQDLQAGPPNCDGIVSRLPLAMPAETPKGVDDWQAAEAGQIADFLLARGPEALGAKDWGEVCVLAPRNSWLLVIREVFEDKGLKVALQMRKNLNRNNAVYAWMTGLLSVLCDNQNVFEWFGVLREVFAVSDAVLAAELREGDNAGKAHENTRNWRWDEPDEHADETLRNALQTLYPFVNGVDDSVEDGGRPLGQFAADLARACGLAEKARLIEPGGSLNDELDRLLAEAAALGLAGAGPRDWLRKLRDGLNSGRPSGKQDSGAINLLTVHSAKGLEWPVVVPVGFWRTVGKRDDTGLRLIVETVDGVRSARAFFDGRSIDDDTAESREREQLRENVRLMYVALTRAQRHLLIPWCANGGGEEGPPAFGKKRTKTKRKSAADDGEANNTRELSFAELWGRNDLLDALPVCDEAEGRKAVTGAGEKKRARLPEANVAAAEAGAPLPAPPARLLPHQLAQKHDVVRGVLHEASADDPPPARDDDAIEYGLWWHETMEELPWGGSDAEIAEYFEKALVAAGGRCGEAGVARGREELGRLRGGAALGELREARWTREAELSIFAPADDADGAGAWIDGIMDLVVHDGAAGEARVIDWKTNRRRAGESDDALLERLRAEYEPQLRAYGRCVKMFFEAARVRMFVYSTAAGKCVEITA